MLKTNSGLKLFIILTIIVSIFTSCSRKLTQVVENKPIVIGKKDVQIANSDPIIEAENQADVAGKSVLEVGRLMAINEKVIIKGSCWDYINEVFIRAGYGKNKTVVYKSQKTGPFVDVSEIKSGDWLYYINHSYNGVEHSGIFVYWKDYQNKIGVTLSYGGEQRNEPGRYREYDLRSVYYITRPGAK